MAVPAQSRRGSLSPQIRKVKKPNLFSSWISSSIYFMAHVQSSWCPHLSCGKKKKKNKLYILKVYSVYSKICRTPSSPFPTA